FSFLARNCLNFDRPLNLQISSSKKGLDQPAIFDGYVDNREVATYMANNLTATAHCGRIGVG
ncbi:MAG: hypothetical protein JAZ17_16250, partial [Candidatus Thiodiazotropha endolucinida]|nr:hypothetical protein [Candidatus Thiodiazotropha taylori]MCG8059575.1 hypothetical protein [Candidatus Thiodiazotropha taylori]MCG8095144.1 hypothetical protein [Candidatus Thiodiazotropha endolucinida]MCW4342913.1 hypothetical protein [Candidatus Thiodiazotropha endolucinida]MCW4348703.1 hypothetical protein [Candidatus Thiodiazotropha endolucinida]